MWLTSKKDKAQPTPLLAVHLYRIHFSDHRHMDTYVPGASMFASAYVPADNIDDALAKAKLLFPDRQIESAISDGYCFTHRLVD